MIEHHNFLGLVGGIGGFHTNIENPEALVAHVSSAQRRMQRQTLASMKPGCNAVDSHERNHGGLWFLWFLIVLWNNWILMIMMILGHRFMLMMLLCLTWEQ